ncbi:two-component system sensor protein [Erythrobacter sp. NAP1]|uniref:hybrid sensor histidine kinase/response regulator n=1 Tax=Erythrobacter sp. NAP1 TaxID=237727 RepID=UPI0000687997|nr:PAS domain-containing hybrid sensor histidine kinase/response regulator [Erythrobacter sp. NAP1]EAQ29071.1 two-component system sensor protein [Erythrobacter sp. NAP1]
MLLGAAIAAAATYVVFLFWLAAKRDRSAPVWLTRQSGVVYGLSLAVYCTSWTFFGGVGTAASAGLDFLPIYLGPILVFTLGFTFVRRVLAQAKAQHSTSIADFLSARYGKSAAVAALVTIIATLGSLPYMALQLRSVGNSLLVLDPELETSVALDEIVLMVAALMALFAILFGSRRADHPGDNAGLVLTIAFESVVKLVALLALAALAIAILLGQPSSDAAAAASVSEVFNLGQIDARFAVLTLIAACAALCLPRQFHMTFVEAESDKASRAMRWVFPIYLAITSAVIVPIVLAGLSALPAGTDPDTIVMALPLSTGNEALALLVFIGGFAASAGMIVVASVALSMMITNDLIAPVAFRRELSGKGDRSEIARKLLRVRRFVIAAVLALAFVVNQSFSGLTALAGLGTLAFAAVAQFAPGLVLGMLTRAGNRGGMIAGLVTGFVTWFALLVLPAATGAAPIFAIHSDPLVSGVLISLGANCAAYWLGSTLAYPSLIDAAQAAAFAGSGAAGGTQPRVTNKRVADIRLLLGQFVGSSRADEAIAAMPLAYRDRDPADAQVISMAERTISGVVGSSSARMLVNSWAGGDPVPLPDIVAMFDETNRRLSFSGELLQIAIENIDQGIAVVDAEMNLVAWNTRYQEMFALPDHLVTVGTPIAKLIRFNLVRIGLDDYNIEEQVERRLEYMRSGAEHRIEREQHDGRIMRIVGSPAPQGGYVTSYTDITADRRAEQALEEKVAERTVQLSEANTALEAATRSKTRFLAAASHDLIQPLNAARLFASALDEEVSGTPQLEQLVKDLDGSIASADRLIRALLDISKLDGGGIEPKPELVAIDRVFDEIVREFSVQAEAKGLSLRRVHTSAWVETDRALLASVLRNLVSNAIRYTEKGGVLLGVRRAGDDIRIKVHDTGRGIAAADVERIFDEFQRASSKDREGLGLGLAIVRRITHLLDVHVETSSEPGRGSCFALHMPLMRWSVVPQRAKPQRNARQMDQAAVLVVDNDEAALNATSALLEKWGLRTTCAGSLAQAASRMPACPELVIMDYRLDGDERGDGVYRALCAQWKAEPPVILLTAEGSEETSQAARSIGANRLLKPSSPGALRALISDCLARAKASEADQSGTESATG